MAKKKKIEAKEQVNGAATPAKSIYDIIGKKTFPYEEKTLEEYQKKLKDMDWTTMQKHAVEVANILPNIDKRDRLIAKLEEAYLKKFYAFLGHDKQKKEPEASAEIMRILSRGK